MRKYLELIELLYIVYLTWKTNESIAYTPPPPCEYCGHKDVQDGVCMLCNKKQPKMKLNLDIIEKRGNHIRAWDKRLAKYE